MPAGAARRAAALLLAALAGSAGAGGVAEAADRLASYWAHSGSLPPQYAWSFAAEIATDGTVTGRRCDGYETSGRACRSATGRATPEALAAIRAAAEASGLSERPAAVGSPPAGGPASGGSVVLDGVTITLPAYPAPADRERVGQVLAVLRAALPTKVVALGYLP